MKQKIWLDLRFLESWEKYSTFVAILVQHLIHLDTDNTYVLYLSDQTKTKFPDKLKVEYIKEKPWSLLEQIKFNNKLKKDNNDLMVFFSDKKPLQYKWKYIFFIKDLKEIHYLDEKSFFSKFIQDLFLNTSLKNATKIICFEEQTRNELNEKLNISEDKLEILYPFFTKEKITEIQTISSIKTKFWIKWEYLIYSWNNWNNKNLSKLVEVLQKLNKRKVDVSLIILDQKVTEDINFRKEVVESWIVEKVLFIWLTTQEEKKAFYNEAIGTIFPSLYESFPFSLTESISYNSPILASSIKQIKEIMWDSISYFSPVSSIDMIEAIENFISKWRKETNYNEIFKKYKPEKSVQQLLNIINKR
jgi:glycosyltransferase involved in cell wall biosynthesis